MTSRERVFAVLNGKKPDRIPNFNILMGFSANYNGKTYKEYITDYKVLAECDYKCSEKFGIDMISAISDPMRECEGFGADVVLPENAVPYSPHEFIEDISDLSKLKTYNPYNNARSEDRIKACEYLRKNAQDYIIGGWVEGAFAEACDLRGINNMLMDVALEEEETIHNFLRITCEQAKMFATAQVKAGADIIGIGDAAASLISPDMYRDFVLPYQKEIVDAVHNAGGKVKLHICGNTTRVLDQMIETGSDIIDLDWMVDLNLAKSIIGDKKVIVCGNYDPVAVVLQGSIEDIKAEVKKCAKIFTDRYISSAGCEIPMFTKEENLLAVKQAIEEI